MARTTQSIANPAGRATVVSNIATDGSAQMTWVPFPESSISEYRAFTTGSLSFFDVADYVPIHLDTGNLYAISLESTVEPAIFLNDGEGYTYVTIDPDGIFGANPDDPNEDSIIAFTPDFTGLHYLNVGPANPSDFG